ncbi:DNA mismatch repair protein [Nocardia sp. 2]|uniref:DNA mismatch repair protein n=1 Tax=Nocardia acididurans TaxID=2802282 RepID=A0ABS1M0Z6_9NOCA|nr:DNA mismatch repair protein [Nocardia acididurans]MBL1073725.1 DNA mismatch repair protein [Nocardia acididurans]
MIPIDLLHPAGHPVRVARNGPDLATDLGLDELFTVMAAGDEFLADVVRTIVPVSLTDIEVIRYRQRVLADCCADPAMLRALYAIAAEATTVRRYMGGLAVLLQPLEALIGHLRRLRRTCERYAASCTAPGLVRFRDTVRAQLDDDYLDSLEKHAAALYFEDGLLFSAALGVGNKPARIMLHEPAKPAKRGLFGRRSGSGFEATSHFEHNHDPLKPVIQPAIAAVTEVVARVTDNVQEFFRRLRTELAFYLGCVHLHERLTAMGAPVCFPDPAPMGAAALDCRDLRDTALALTSTAVVGNDITGAGITFLVVTGANSGGKSTFLRSVGTAQLLMQAGIFVPARTFTAGLRDGVFTHFVRAEDPTMTHGRLDEELARMRAITDALRPAGMLLCNEPFASTNDRDATAIATPILSALLASGVTVVLVTHLYDYAHQRHAAAHPTDLFLRPARTGDGARTYHLTPAAPEPTSHGDDVFAATFGYRLPE